MNQIKLTCSCGATAEFMAPTFYNDIRKDADAWLERHAKCTAPNTAPVIAAYAEEINRYRDTVNAYRDTVNAYRELVGAKHKFTRVD